MNLFSSSKSAKKYSNSLQKAEQEWLDSLRESRKLLDTAASQAEKIVGEAGELSQNTKKLIERQVQEAIEEVTGEIRDKVNHIVEQSISSQQKVSRSLEEQSKELMRSLEEQSMSELKRYHEENESNIAAVREKSEKVLLKYIQKEEVRITRLLVEAIPNVIRETTGEAIELADHERLVMAALKKIGKEIKSSYGK